MDNSSKEKDSYCEPDNDNYIDILKNQYAGDVDNIKEDSLLNPLLESNSLENISSKINTNFNDSVNTSMLNINKSGKCTVDINKLYMISKQLEGCRTQQKKLVLTMNHIMNEYSTLNKNFKKIQKELDNLLNAPNENENNPAETLDKSPILFNGSMENDETPGKNRVICPALKSINKELFIEDISKELICLLNDKVEKIFVEEGQHIIKKGERDPYIYYLTSGEAYVYDFFDNKVANVYQESWFGLMSSIIGKERSADVKATLDCKLYRISIEDVKKVLSKDPEASLLLNNLTVTIGEIYNTCQNMSFYKNSLCRFHNEFLIELTMNILTKIPLFEHRDAKFLYDLVSNMEPEVVPRGKIIISRDDEPDCLYCVLNGSVEVFSYADKEDKDGKEDKNKNSKDMENNKGNVMVHAEISSGSFFGEIGLLLGIKRTSSIRIKEKSFLLKLNKGALTTISEKYPKIQLNINKRTSGCMLAIQEKMVNNDSLEQFDLEVNCQNLRKIKLFNNFDNTTLEEIAMGMTRESYKPDEYIIKCGDNAESMFFLTHGSIEVISENNKVVDIAKGPNVYFGEVALLEDVPRTASIKATTPCSVFVLTKKTLLSVLKKNSQFEAEIEKTSRERLQRHLMRSILA